MTWMYNVGISMALLEEDTEGLNEATFVCEIKCISNMRDQHTFPLLGGVWKDFEAGN